MTLKPNDQMETWEFFTWIIFAAIITGWLFLATGCVSIHQQPILPMPQVPELHFKAAGPVCLDEPEANLLWQYFDKLDAYQRAIEVCDGLEGKRDARSHISLEEWGGIPVDGGSKARESCEQEEEEDQQDACKDNHIDAV